MKQFYWFILVLLGAIMVFNPRFNISLPSLGLIVLLVGIFGLIKSLLTN